MNFSRVMPYTNGADRPAYASSIGSVASGSINGHPISTFAEAVKDMFDEPKQVNNSGPWDNIWPTRP